LGKKGKKAFVSTEVGCGLGAGTSIEPACGERTHVLHRDPMGWAVRRNSKFGREFSGPRAKIKVCHAMVEGMGERGRVRQRQSLTALVA